MTTNAQRGAGAVVRSAPEGERPIRAMYHSRGPSRFVNATSIRKSIVRNTTWNYVGFAVNLAVNLLLFPAVVARLGDAATGVWLLIGSVSGQMGLLQLGLAPAIGQFAAEYLAK